jgi:hypothetical protein
LVPAGQVTVTNHQNVSIVKGEVFVTGVNWGYRAPGSPQLALTSSPRTDDAASAQPLTQEMLQPIVAEALARWQAAGVAPEVLVGLSQATIRVADLSEDFLGWSNAEGITIDVNAAGYGWFVDPTPADDVEFPAAAGSPADGHMDLLTVVAHELGHSLGLPDIHDDADLMGETLPSGVRRVPTPSDVKQAEALGLPGLTTIAGNPTPNVTAPLPTDFRGLVDLAGLPAATFGAVPLTPVAIALGGEDQPDLLAFQDALPLAARDDAPLLLTDDRQQAWAAPASDTATLDVGFNLSLVDDPAVPALWPPQ